MSVLREKDVSVSVLQKDNIALREQLEKMKFDLERSQAETRTEKENLKRWKRMTQKQLAMNIACVNR